MQKTIRTWVSKIVLTGWLATSVFAASAPAQAAASGVDKPSLASGLLVIRMPEPSYPATLAADLLGMAGLILVFRRRIAGILR